jgi:hypothetical protein
LTNSTRDNVSKRNREVKSNSEQKNKNKNDKQHDFTLMVRIKNSRQCLDISNKPPSSLAWIRVASVGFSEGTGAVTATIGCVEDNLTVTRSGAATAGSSAGIPHTPLSLNAIDWACKCVATVGLGTGTSARDTAECLGHDLRARAAADTGVTSTRTASP